MVKNLTEVEFAKMINEKKDKSEMKLTIIDCYTDWCAPCKAAAPHFAKMSEIYSNNADFIKINIDNNPKVAYKLKVQAVPTFLILNGNKIKSRIVGADMNKLEKEIIKTIKAS